MEEISDPPNPTREISEPMSEFDPKTMRTTKPGAKRLLITTSVLVCFLLGFPFLWKSVEIYRSPLPFHDIDSLSGQIESSPLQFPCTFHAIFVGFRSMNPSNLRSAILDGVTQFTHRSSGCGSCNFSLSVTVQDPDDHCTETIVRDPSKCSYRCGVIKGNDFGIGLEDAAVDESLNDIFGGCTGHGGKIYSVVVVNKDLGNGEGEVRAVVGKHRHAWIVGSGLEERYGDMVAKVSEIFVKVFMKGGREESSINGEFMPVGSDGKVVLSFNLLNSNPRDWVYDWDFQRIDETLLSPVIKALEPVANISVESQVLYHTPKSSFASWDEKLRSHIFRMSDLPFFVNSNEWHLDTSVGAGGRSKILQFVVYIPSAGECPLQLQLPNGEMSKTNGFISPMWGGVIVWNPANCDKGSGSPARTSIPPQNLEKIFEVFLGQFRQLFGFKSEATYTSGLGTFEILPSERGFTEWELDVLSRQHTCFNLQSCANTLGSLSRLVQSLPRMIIKDEIGEQVKFSLKAAKMAQSNASLGAYGSSASSSREARSLAEDAFFHPSIMSVSYFSFEHCFAVYSPFFLPVSMHVILAALREWKRYKQEKAKYLTSLTRKKTA
ncbi:PREDICTED: GPI transamidase component PIG-S [Tarenaya hassleriana]|uniref:GPI transamidase component PIG-S n=1 Tax=Tarenaya hassleriana TaxID=28532 RepID=UPI00053C3077|nr:PREDICTED: GPI transamidase component PIG-S [Tarenaya hassleriana]